MTRTSSSECMKSNFTNLRIPEMRGLFWMRPGSNHSRVLDQFYQDLKHFKSITVYRPNIVKLFPNFKQQKYILYITVLVTWCCPTISLQCLIWGCQPKKKGIQKSSGNDECPCLNQWIWRDNLGWHRVTTLPNCRGTKWQSQTHSLDMHPLWAPWWDGFLEIQMGSNGSSTWGWCGEQLLWYLGLKITLELICASSIYIGLRWHTSWLFNVPLMYSASQNFSAVNNPVIPLSQF